MFLVINTVFFSGLCDAKWFWHSSKRSWEAGQTLPASDLWYSAVASEQQVSQSPSTGRWPDLSHSRGHENMSGGEERRIPAPGSVKNKIKLICLCLRPQEKLMGHLGVVLYEYLGEEYPEVLGSILGALKAIVNVIGKCNLNCSAVV